MARKVCKRFVYSGPRERYDFGGTKRYEMKTTCGDRRTVFVIVVVVVVVRGGPTRAAVVAGRSNYLGRDSRTDYGPKMRRIVSRN